MLIHENKKIYPWRRNYKSKQNCEIIDNNNKRKSLDKPIKLKK